MEREKTWCNRIGADSHATTCSDFLIQKVSHTFFAPFLSRSLAHFASLSFSHSHTVCLAFVRQQSQVILEQSATFSIHSLVSLQCVYCFLEDSLKNHTQMSLSLSLTLSAFYLSEFICNAMHLFFSQSLKVLFPCLTDMILQYLNTVRFAMHRKSIKWDFCVAIENKMI